MKKKCTSTFEVRINTINVGFAVNLYHYETDRRLPDLISTEFIPYGILKTIEGIQLNPKLLTYIEKKIMSNNQDETQMKSLLNTMILNNSDYAIEFIKRRQVFNVDFKLDTNVFRYQLIHEHSFEEYKQVQLPPENEIIKFEFSDSDDYIITQVESIIREKYS